MSLAAFFNPKSVAVVGASREPAHPGHVIFRNLTEGDYEGAVFPVNPKAEELFGHKCYDRVTEIKEPIELAVIVVPSKVVLDVLGDCKKKGIKHVIIISGGFKETGNLELEKKLCDFLKKSRIRAIGPNCMGVLDPYSALDTIFNPHYKSDRPGQGSISFITQSGAVGIVILDWMGMKGYNISKFISYGNAADVDECDLIEYLASDNTTSVICAFLEGAKEGRKFFDVTSKLSKKKPIIILKGGTTSAGTVAVKSHTGSLAGSAEIYGAAFKQAGIIQAQDIEEMFDFARVLSTQPMPKGKRVQVITDGGGFGVMTVDWLTKHGLELAQMQPTRLNKLKKLFPPHVVVRNPIDLTGDATAEWYQAALQEALEDPNVDMVALILLLQLPTLSPKVVELVVETARESKKPIVVISAGGRYTEVLKKSLEDSGIPTFSYPERATMALKKLEEYAAFKKAK